MQTLTHEGFLELVRLAREGYIEAHEETSLITSVAVALINQYIDDVQKTKRREPITFLTRVKLQSRMGVRDDETSWSENSWNNVATDVGRAFENFYHDTAAFGQSWRVSFKGPTRRFGVPGKTGTLAVRAVIHDRDSSLAHVRDAMRIAEAAKLVGVCLCCGKEYDWDLDKRLCTAEGCDAGTSRPAGSEVDLYVSILPERRGANYNAGLSDGDRERLFRLVDDSRDSSIRHRRTVDAGNVVALSDLLPYAEDHLENAGLTLGTPLVYSAPRLAAHARFGDVFVLDLSTYGWSNTLKDPKSWATINAAIGAGISQLALYTAGNAGVSLAKLAYSLKGVARSKLRVFALVDSKADADLQTYLRMWGATLVRLNANQGQRLIDPKAVWSKIAAETGIAVPERKDRWHVTDGWDGVGIVMYRLLFREVVRTVRPDYLIVPIGTGSLFIGAHLGLRDAWDLDYATKLVGVVPAGKNILTPLHTASDERMADTAPMAPKLVGDYTPLHPCVSHIVEKHHAQIVTVSRRMQIDVLRYLDDADGHTIAAEPSAVLAIAALSGDDAHVGVREIARSSEAPHQPEFRDYSSKSRVMVVNTGMGVLGHDEAEFLARYRLTNYF